MGKTKLALLALPLVLATSCAQHYELAGIERTRILIDDTFDKRPVAQAEQFIIPYKHTVDSLMNPVIGRAACDLTPQRPEGTLSNLLPDILIEAGEAFGEKPDFAVYNMGGIRASLPKGDITVGDILDVAPFENKICFLTLTGEKVLELFRQMAGNGGEAVSHGVRLAITAGGELVSAEVNGKPVDPKASYRIATLDFVAQGNDRMVAFKAKTDVVSPKSEENNVRHFIEKYFKKKMEQGQAVSAQTEGRIVIKADTEDRH